MAWAIAYYRQADGRVPVDEFLAGCPVKVRARLLAVLDDVAEAPPPQFSGGGRWEAMHGTMRGYYEVAFRGLAASSSDCSAFSRTLTPRRSSDGAWLARRSQSSPASASRG